MRSVEWIIFSSPRRESSTNRRRTDRLGLIDRTTSQIRLNRAIQVPSKQTAIVNYQLPVPGRTFDRSQYNCSLLHFSKGTLLWLHHSAKICGYHRLFRGAWLPIIVTVGALSRQLTRFCQVEELRVVRALVCKCPALRTFDYHPRILPRSELQPDEKFSPRLSCLTCGRPGNLEFQSGPGHRKLDR
jgi:hypothetical protein